MNCALVDAQRFIESNTCSKLFQSVSIVQPTYSRRGL